MSAINRTTSKTISFRRALIILGISVVGAALAAYIWILTAQTITPPGLRIMDYLWRTFSWLRA